MAVSDQDSLSVFLVLSTIIMMAILYHTDYTNTVIPRTVPDTRVLREIRAMTSRTANIIVKPNKLSGRPHILQKI